MEKIILGNWKMNPRTKGEAVSLAYGVVKGVKGGLVGIAPPLVFIDSVSNVISKSKIMLGAQDVFWEDEGRYTGEISVGELKSLGVEFVIVGHSEKREIGETNVQINKKIKKILKNNLKVILCVGESKDMREKGIDVAKKFVSGELEKDLNGINILDHDSLIIAYEPIWAISNRNGGESASLEEVLEMISYIKKFLKVNNINKNVSILYGGSVNEDNVKKFLSEDNIDGVLVGNASLDLGDFLKIIQISYNYKK